MKANRTARSNRRRRSIIAILNEDVGYGLVPMAEIGKLLGDRTPVMDALITLASTALGANFRQDRFDLAEKWGSRESHRNGLPSTVLDGF